MTSPCHRSSANRGRGVVSHDSRWLPRSRRRSATMVVAVVVALAAGVGCGADDPEPDPGATIRTRYELVTSSICAELDIEAIVADVAAVVVAEPPSGRLTEYSYASEVTCRIQLEGADDRFDHDHWQFDPTGWMVVTVYGDIHRLESNHRSLLDVEQRAVDDGQGTLEEVEGWWEAGTVRTSAVLATAEGFDPPRHIQQVTSVRTIRHHNLLLQVILDAYAPVGEEAVAPLLDELTGRLVEEVGAHLTLETVTVPPEAGG